MEKKLLLINITDYKYPPVSFAYVMSELKKSGICYDFVDLPKDNIPLLYKVLANGDYFAMATGSLIGGYADLEIVFDIVKKQIPEIPTILGGRIAAVCPAHLLEKLKVDYLVIGDACPTLVELLRFIAARQKKIALRPVEGTAFRRRGSFYYAKERKQPSLERFFPYWDDVELSRYDYPYQYPVVTCIGCVGKCTFCAPGVGQIRLRPVKNVIDEIKAARRGLGIKRFEIISEIFYPSARSIIEFCCCLSGLSMNLRWRCNLRTDIPLKVFPYMAEAGCREIIFGVESYDDNVLHGMKKLVSKETIQAAIKEANAHGIRVTAGLMAGNVNDTPETLEKTADFVVDNNIMVDRPSFFSPLLIYPGTELYAEALRKGLIEDEYKYIKDISRSLYSYLNPTQKRYFLPEGFINVTGMSDNQLEYAIEYNEWIMYQNAFTNWKLKDFDGSTGCCCYCNKNFAVENSLRTRKNAIICPECLAYNLVPMDQTASFRDRLHELVDMFEGNGRFAFIGTRENAYWLTSFVGDNEKIRNNWSFFYHTFLNPGSRYLCGHEVRNIQELCRHEFDHLILCDIMCPKYYVDLLASCGGFSSSIHWLFPYECYEHTYDYVPTYACNEELRHVAADLADECEKTFDGRDELVVIQNNDGNDFGEFFSEALLRLGLHIMTVFDATGFCPDYDAKSQRYIRFISYCREKLAGIVILDHNPIRQYQIATMFHSEITKGGLKVVSLNEFLFEKYALQEYKGTGIVQG